MNRNMWIATLSVLFVGCLHPNKGEIGDVIEPPQDTVSEGDMDTPIPPECEKDDECELTTAYCSGGSEYGFTHDRPSCLEGVCVSDGKLVQEWCELPCINEAPSCNYCDDTSEGEHCITDKGPDGYSSGRCKKGKCKPGCSKNPDCDDHNPCTTDVCHDEVGGYCMNIDKPYCTACDMDEDCPASGKQCYANSCIDGVCALEKADYSDCHLGLEKEGGFDMGICLDGSCKTFACGASKDCDDGDPCTQDFLGESGCRSTRIEGCKPCEVDKDCHSPELCGITKNGACISGLCTFNHSWGEPTTYTNRTGFVCSGSVYGAIQLGGSAVTPTVNTNEMCTYQTFDYKKVHLYTYDRPPDNCWCLNEKGYGYRADIKYIPSPEERWVLKCCSQPPL